MRSIRQQLKSYIKAKARQQAILTNNRYRRKNGQPVRAVPKIPEALWRNFSKCKESHAAVIEELRAEVKEENRLRRNKYSSKRKKKLCNKVDVVKAHAELRAVADSVGDEEAAVVKRELAQRQLARKHLIGSVIRFNPEYLAGWVHKDICARLERFMLAVAAGQNPRLMLQMPPRHGKSTLASQEFPAWVLGHHPDWELIVTSYAETLALDFSRAVRERMRDPEFQVLFPNTKLDPENQNAKGWKTNRKGGFLPAGVEGPITGKGAHILIIDDPIKNSQEAESELKRAGILKWYSSTAYTRLAPGGGVLIIQCMVGSTPVTMGDGSKKLLRDIQVGDEVATYDAGRLTTSYVSNWLNQGPDKVYKIRTTSGKMVKANKRHPFLVEDDTGELQWVRVSELRLGQKIVTVKDNGASGEVKHVSRKAAVKKSAAGAFAYPTTVSGHGPQVTALRPMHHTLSHVSVPSLSTATGLLLRTTNEYSQSKMANVLFAGYRRLCLVVQSTGKKCSALITAMRLTQPGVSSATIVTSLSNEATPSKYFKPLSSTSDFTTEAILSIEPAGVEDVFDIQVDRTENFIANGITSSNTRWHLDDLSGRLEMDMAEGNGDVFEIVRYPAVAVEDEKHRLKGEPLHAARYSHAQLKMIKKAVGERTWAALYQQNPVPEHGAQFQRSMINYYQPDELPEPLTMASAWDLAIGQKEVNDKTVGFTWGRDIAGDFWFVDCRHGHFDALEIVEEICDSYEKHNPYTVGIEKDKTALALGPLLDTIIEDRGLYGLHVTELRPMLEGKKVQRCRTLQGLMRRGKIHLPHPDTADWVEEFVTELLQFPYGRRDDHVDAAAWLALMSVDMPSPGLGYSNVPKRVSWRDRLAKMARRERTSMSA